MEANTAERKLVRIKPKGQVTLPVDMRRDLGLKEGDLVEVTRTPEGLLITPQEVVAIRAMDEIGRVLREKGVSLEDLMDSGRQIRGELVREMYGIDSDDKDN